MKTILLSELLPSSPPTLGFTFKTIVSKVAIRSGSVCAAKESIGEGSMVNFCLAIAKSTTDPINNFSL